MTGASGKKGPDAAMALKAVRDRTGAPWMECRAVLAEANGDIEKAVAILQEKTSRSDVQSPPASARPSTGVLIFAIVVVVVICVFAGYNAGGLHGAVAFAPLGAAVGGLLLALRALTGGQWPTTTSGSKIKAPFALLRSTAGGTRTATALGALAGTIAGAVFALIHRNAGWNVQGVREVVNLALSIGCAGAFAGALVGGLVSRIVAVFVQRIKKRPVWCSAVHGLVVGATVGAGLGASAWGSVLAWRAYVDIVGGRPIDLSDWLVGLPELAALGASLGAVAGAITARSSAKRQTEALPAQAGQMGTGQSD